MQCVILAGGLATRMRPLTDTLPKSLLAVGSKPFISYQLDWLVKQGITDVLLCIGYKGEMIRRFLGQGESWNIRLRYVDEGENLRGTAGALRLALEAGYLDPEFCVLYGDSYLLLDIQSVWHFFQNRSEPALMTVFRNENQWDRSNVSFHGDKVLLYDKMCREPNGRGMQFIDYGLSLFRRTVVEKDIPKTVKYDLAEVLHILSKRGDLAGFEVKERFFEIGSPGGLADFAKYMGIEQ